MDIIREAIYNTLSAQHPATCRGLFYALVSQGVIDKTETEYKSTVIRLTGAMRRDGTLPYSWLADNTRWMRKPRSWNSVEQVLQETARVYRRNLWHESDSYVEVWLEKDALAGVIMDVTSEWDVPLMVTRGYASLSFLYSAAETIKAHSKPTTIYYLGDLDPSGVDIPKKVEAGLREMAPDITFSFTRLAVNPDQVEDMRLPTRPTKRTDSRSRSFTGESVEVDAIPAPVLRDMVAEAILQHVDLGQLDVLLTAEQDERRYLEMIARVTGR